MTPPTVSQDRLEELGREIAAARVRAGLTVRDAAAKTATATKRPIGFSTWSAIENARNGVPSHPDTYRRIESVVGWELGSCMDFLRGHKEHPGGPNIRPRAVVTDLVDDPSAAVRAVVVSVNALPADKREAVLAALLEQHRTTHNAGGRETGATLADSGTRANV